MKRIITINDLLKYKETPGVWAILGKKEQEWHWLNVAATENIGDEISEDVYLMTKKISKRGKEKIYKNYWKEEIFTYKIFSYNKLSKKKLQEKHRRARWIHISETYDELIIICCLENESDSQKRFKIERYIAIKTHALYWNDIKKVDPRNLDSDEFLDTDNLIKEINKEFGIDEGK